MSKFKKAFDDFEFEKDLQELAKLMKKSLPEVNREQAALILRDCLKYTPPTKDAKSVEGVVSRRDAGKKAIDRNVDKVFQPVSKLKWFSNPTDYTRRNIEGVFRTTVIDGDLEKATVMLRAVGVNGRIVKTPDKTVHISRMNSRGRTRKGEVFYISDESALVAYKKNLYKQIGKGIQGWRNAANALKVKMPTLGKKAARWAGTFSQKLDDWRAGITCTNDVPYLQDSGRAEDITERAKRNRGLKLAKQVKMTIAGNLRRAKRLKVMEQTQKAITG